MKIGKKKKKPEGVKETSIYFINAILFIKQIIWHILCNLCKLSLISLKKLITQRNTSV